MHLRSDERLVQSRMGMGVGGVTHSHKGWLVDLPRRNI